MKLYLVQHGEALAKAVDPDRPLSERGRADVGRLAGFLERAGVRAARVIHSGKARARQTADLLARAMAPAGVGEVHAGLGPNDPPDAFAAEARAWSDDVVVVGHLPFMGKLAARLVTGRDEVDAVAFQPGAMVCLERAEGAEGAAWTIAWMLCPELLAG